MNTHHPMKSTNPLFAALVLAFTVLFHAQAQSWLTNELVAYYPFNGNANDASGNDRSLTNSGAVLAMDRFGKTNRAYSFDGASSIMIGTNSSDDLVLHDAFTMSCWVNISDFNPNGSSLVRKDGDSGINLLNFDTPNQFAVETFRDGRQYRAFSETIPAGEWCMLAATWDGTNFAQFINGEQRTSVQDDFVRTTENAPITLGGSIKFPGQVLSGKLDDVRIYDRPLSSNEVAQLYAIEFGPFIHLVKAVKPSFSNLALGTNYQLQLSWDLNSWTNEGSVFTATNSTMIYPQYYDVDDWDKLFFRLQVYP